MPEPTRILVVRPDRIGDVVLATPLLRALRARFPSAYIAALVRPYAADVLEGNPHLNAVILDDPEADRFLAKLGEIRSHRFDTALHLLPSKRHTWLTFFAGIRTRIGVGSKPYHALTFMRTVSRHNYVPPRHEADYCLDLGRALGVESDDLAVELFVTDEERKTARKRLGSIQAKRLVGVVPASGGSAPNWTASTYAGFCRAILEQPDTGVVVLAAGTNVDVNLFQELDRRRSVIVTDTSVREAISIIANFDALVSSSTGPMHIAAGLKIPTVSLFCPLPACSDQLWGPRGNDSAIITPPTDYCSTRCPGDPKLCTYEGAFAIDEIASITHDLIVRIAVKD